MIEPSCGSNKSSGSLKDEEEQALRKALAALKAQSMFCNYSFFLNSIHGDFYELFLKFILRSILGYFFIFILTSQRSMLRCFYRHHKQNDS